MGNLDFRTQMNRYTGTKKAILRALKNHNSQAVPELASELDAHPAVIDRCCSTLQRSGYLRQTAPGVYLLTTAGEARLTQSPAD